MNFRESFRCLHQTVLVRGGFLLQHMVQKARVSQQAREHHGSIAGSIAVPARLAWLPAWFLLLLLLHS